MADNYLEKRMEDHARGRDSLHYVAARPKGSVSMRKPARKVFAVGHVESEYASRIVSSLVASGVKVAFSGSDYRGGTLLAQKLGARFVDAEPEEAMRKAAEAWGGLDFMLCFGNPGQELENAFAAISPDGGIIAAGAIADAAGKGWNAVAADSADPAHAVLFLMLPQAVALRGVFVR